MDAPSLEMYLDMDHFSSTHGMIYRQFKTVIYIARTWLSNKEDMVFLVKKLPKLPSFQLHILKNKNYFEK
jgi:hypothetical protein